MESVVVAGIDPGEVSGVAIFRLELEPPLLRLGVFEMPGLWEALEREQPQAVAIEKFALYPWMAKKLGFSTMAAPEAIGVVRSWTDRRGIKLYRVWARERMPYLRLVPETISSPHLRDAIAIGLCYLRRELSQSPKLEDWRIESLSSPLVMN